MGPTVYFLTKTNYLSFPFLATEMAVKENAGPEMAAMGDLF